MVLHLPTDREHLLKALSEKERAIAPEIILNHRILNSSHDSVWHNLLEMFKYAQQSRLNW